MRISSIAAVPSVDRAIGALCYDLSEDTPWDERGKLWVLDLASGRNYKFPNSTGGNFFYHVICGSHLTVHDSQDTVARAKATDAFGMMRPEDFLIINEGVTAARVVVMHSTHPWAHDRSAHRHIESLEWHSWLPGVSYLPLWVELGLANFGEYELLQVNGRIPRHRHRESAAMFYVISGSGHVGMDVGQSMWTSPIQAGSYGYLPAGEWHGFHGTDMRMAVAQIPAATGDDTEDGDVDYDYQLKLQ